MRISLSQGMEQGRSLQILTARWQLFEDSAVKKSGVIAKLNVANSETYSFDSGWGNFDPQTNEAAVELTIPDFFPSGMYSVNFILMKDVALNARGVYFTDPEHGLRDEDVIIDEAPATIAVQTENPDGKAPVLDLNGITVRAEPTNPEAPNGETRVYISFRVKDDISGYRSTDMHLRDPQGVEHFFRHYDSDFYRIYFSRDPAIYQTYHQTITLPVGSIPGRWGLSEMTVWDKARNKLQADFTEIIRFEVTDPEGSAVTTGPSRAIPGTLEKVSGDRQRDAPGALLEMSFVVAVRDQNGHKLAGAPVRFDVTDGSGTLSVETAISDSSGTAASRLTLGDGGPGTNVVTVTFSGIDEPVIFVAEAVYTADFNGDGTVDFIDFVQFAAQFGLSQGDAAYDARYDLDEDGTIGFSDFLIFANAFGNR